VKENAGLCRNANDNQRDLCRRMASFLRACAANFEKPQQRTTDTPKTIRLTPITVLSYRDTSQDQQQKQAMHEFMVQFYIDLHSPEKTAELYWKKEETSCSWDTPESGPRAMPPIDIACEPNQGVVVTGRIDTENRMMLVHMKAPNGVSADAKIQMRFSGQ